MTWTLDPHHTSVAFSAKHMGVSTVRGRFDQVDANLELDDPNDPTTGRGTITVQAGSITTGSDMRDGHLKGADFLDVEKYPTIVFTLKSVKETGNDNFKAIGDLTIKGVTKEVALDYEHNGLREDGEHVLGHRYYAAIPADPRRATAGPPARVLRRAGAQGSLRTR